MTDKKAILVIGAGDATRGAIAERDNFPERYALKEQDGIVQPSSIATAYWNLHQQSRDAWTHEMELPPWMETF